MMFGSINLSEPPNALQLFDAMIKARSDVDKELEILEILRSIGNSEAIGKAQIRYAEKKEAYNIARLRYENYKVQRK